MIQRSLSAFCLLSLLALPLFTNAQDEGDPKPVSLKQARAEFARADAALNKVWAKAKESLETQEFNALKEDQKGWLEMRDSLATSPSYSGAPADDAEAKQSPEYLSTAASLMQDRVKWLEAYVANEPGDTMTGEWADSRGGHIEIVETEDGHLHFIIETVRGHTADLGQLAGIATWNSTLGWFTDKGRDKDREDETNLAFIWRDHVLEIVGANTEYYHGKRAWFDGRYVKVGELDKKTTTRVNKAAKTGEIPEE